ncbi:mitoguardin-like [Daphnia carinata]|uniref:mitoguardin-like n=1 Tax=Daphnia carinata TaxID=120202 RepID=UPI0025803652|nr:mitoguardin-like [Daphnia carinata]
MVLNFAYSTRPTLTWGSFAIRLPYFKVTGLSLSKPQKVVIISLTVGVGLVTLLSRYLRRRKRIRPTQPSRLDAATLNRRLRSGFRSPNGDFLSEFQSTSPVPQRIHRTRSASVNSDRYSVSEGADAKSTPQLLGTMGVESLETAINYWEDALAAYQSNSTGAALLTAEEVEFCRSLERVLKAAYVLQDETEHLFLHEHSVLFQTESATNVGYASGSHTLYSRTSYSFTSADSFVSAVSDEVADLEDFADLPVDDSLPSLYQGSMKQLDESGIPCRVLRTELTGCQSDIEYLCKLHCIRLACQGVFHLAGADQWFISAGRSLLTELLMLADKDPRDVLEAYDAMMVFVQDTEQRFKLAAEMEHRGVKAVTFYDVVLDFILMDAFEDLTAPPSSVLAVINNRWLSNGFKEGALATAVWSVLKAKRRKLLYQDGFISHFYGIMEHLSPVLAWGFLGPDSDLKKACFIFKNHVEGYLRDIFDFERVRYLTVEEMAEDVWALAKERREAITRQMPRR